MSEYIVEAINVKKTFAGVEALKGVNLKVKKGEIHCLAGENGSGKSTLIKIISGIYTMDSGNIEFNGVKHTKISPIEAIMNGVQVIYQDFSIFQNLSVIENIAFNSEIADTRKLVNWKRFKKIAEEAVKRINFKVDLNAIVGELPVADKQLVAICRALTINAKLIIMDEPTTALTNKEVEALFKIIKDLQTHGIATLFVSHKLDEVFEISERFTILRNGENVITENTSDLNNEKFIYFMTGRKFEKKQFVDNKMWIDEKPILEVKNLSSKTSYKDISFILRKGEILGITGLLGCGKSQLAHSLFGLRKPDSGEIFINGKKEKLNNVEDALRCKIGFVPGDRLTEGLFLSQSIGRNIIIAMIKKIVNKFGVIKEPLMKLEINKWVKKLVIATPDSDNAARTLSGGNQQRLVLAKWLATDLEVLILNGPTVGVDIGSKYDIHKILHNLANDGLGILIISDDLPEIMANCNRVLIMIDGKTTGEVDPGTITEHELAERMKTTNKIE
ncbi:MAG: sugar ABC transporter ATP-binding protein [Candidatus Humimicrobiaceae bacterium]